MQLIKPRQISGEIMTLIEEADKKVILVSPYFKVKNWHKLINIFNTLINRRIEVEMFVREGEHDSIKEAREVGFRPITIPHLHTKLYMNEKIAIVSSMNLLYSSDTSSLDIALKTENQKEYDEVMEYYNRYIAQTNISSQPTPSTQSSTYSWRGDLKVKLTESFGDRVKVEEQSSKILIQTRNRYEASMEKGNGSEFQISAILSGKEFEYANKYSNKLKVKGMQIELSEGGNGHYNTAWGICRNMSSYKITEPLASEAQKIVDMIVGFIQSVEQLKSSLR